MAYTIIAAAMTFGFIGTASWLVAPDPSAPIAAPAAPPIPPRIAESIARKTAWVPEQSREMPPARVTNERAMQHSDVSLVSPVEVQPRTIAPPPQRPRKPLRTQQAGIAMAATVASPRAVTPIAAGRNDNPY
jgi:hypothetical protein